MKLVIEYDGTDYRGWQTQANGVAVQAVLEKCLEKLLRKKTRVVASGRTDAGVHALGQVVSVKAAFPMDDGALLRGLNSLLPEDIAVKSAATAPLSFHARKDAKWKKYRYLVHNSPIPSPLSARTSWHIPYALNVRAMAEGAGALTGRHDFASFMGLGSPVKSTVREIFSASVRKDGEKIVFEFTGNGFLKNMVRNIVGTLVEVGRGRFSPRDVKRILAARERKSAGPTAPPRGLFLVEVGYR